MSKPSLRLTLPLLALLTLPAGRWAAGPPAAIRVSPEQLRLRIGESARLRTRIVDADGIEAASDSPLVFLSMSPRAVTVDADGLVTAYAPGSHAIVVMLPQEGVPRDAAIAARVPVEVPYPPLANVELTGVPETVYASTRLRVDARAVDASAAERPDVEVRYATDDPAAARVDRFGNLDLLAPGEVVVRAVAGDRETAVTLDVRPNPAATVRLEADADRVRTGDVVHLRAQALDGSGRPVAGVPVQLSFRARTAEHGVGEPPSGRLTEDGRFVADLPGEYTVFANVGDLWTSTSVVAVPRDVHREVELVGQAPVRDRFTSDLWVWEGTDGRDYAITGTWQADGHAYMWDVTDPGNMQLIDTIKVDARTVNDVKVSEDGRVAVISREGASNRRNGLVILDVSKPTEGMKVLSRYDDQLTGGVHNVFIYDHHVYALSAGRRYDIIDIEDPSNPYRVGRFELDTPGHSIHDVWVQDGIAYSSNWDDGVVVVDVGGGGHGGSPRNPVQMGSYTYPSGWNHAAFPYHSASTGKFYVFAGDEAVLHGHVPGYDERLELMDGYIHVIEWDDWGHPRQVARYQVPEAGSHNLWVKDDVLYIAYYQGGLRMVDVSGELLGDLYRQGREIATFKPFDPQGFIPNVAMTWGPQPHKGTIFFSDLHSGLWAVRLKEREPKPAE